MEYINLLSIIILCFFLRVIFIISKASDVSLHLWHVKKSKIYGFGKHNAFDSIIVGIKGYPSLTAYIVSFFSNKEQIKAAYILNIIYDCISIFVFYLIAEVIFSRDLIFKNPQNINLPFIATILFGTSPILFPFTSRLKSFGGRTFGSLLNNIYFAFLGIYFFSGKYIFLLPCIICGVLILLSSQFGMQVMVLFSIGVSIAYANLAPDIVLALIFCAGLSFRQLGIRDIVKHKINHYIWYQKNYKVGTTASGRNRLMDFILYPLIVFKSPKKFYQLTFKKLTPIIAIYSLPSLIFVIAWTINDYEGFKQLLNNHIVKYLFYISIYSCIIFILISFKWLSFLGEAERYFEYSNGAIILLFVILCYYRGYQNLLFYMSFLHISIILFNFIASVRHKIKREFEIEKDKKFSELMEFLNSPEKSFILSIPTKLNYQLGNYSNGNHKFYYQFISENKIDGFKRQQEDEIIYNYVKPDFDHFFKRYKINTIVVEKGTLRKAKKKYGIEYDFSDLKLAFENSEFLVFKS